MYQKIKAPIRQMQGNRTHVPVVARHAYAYAKARSEQSWVYEGNKVYCEEKKKDRVEASIARDVRKEDRKVVEVL